MVGKKHVKVSPRGTSGTGSWTAPVLASFKRVFKMMLKEFKLIKTDVPNLLLALVVPPLLIVVFSFMMSFSGEPPVVNVAIITYDSNAFFDETSTTIDKDASFTAPVVDALNSSEGVFLVEFFNATENEYAMDDARMLLNQGQVQAIVIIPVEFSEFLDHGLPGIIDTVVDASDLLKIQVNLNVIQGAIDNFTRVNGLTPWFVDEVVPLYGIPEGYNPDFNMNMGLVLPFVMIGISMVLTILVVVQEKPVPRLLLTPVTKAELLLSKYLTYTALLSVQSVSVLVATLFSGLYIIGQPSDLFGALFMLGFSGVCVGIFISSVSNTKTEANQLFFAFFIVLFLLSGIFIPIDGMPPAIQVIAYSLPLAHGAPIINEITTKGASLATPAFFILVLISAVFIILSFIIFTRKRMEV